MRTATSSTISLPIHRVDVVESNVPETDGWIRCEIGENLIVDSASIQSYCLAKWDSCVYDALVLAAAVQYCDLTKRRSSRIWGRDFLLRVPVHDPARWNSTAVSKSLHAALRLLTGDNWQVHFTPRRDQFQPPLQSNFCIPGSSGVVIPFSDGLDSFAVAKLMEQQHSSSVIRVRLGSRQLLKRSADCQPFAYVPFRVKTQRTVESSARSRGFKFALLCGIAAHLLGSNEIVVPESGQGVLGPVLVPVGQGYEDYRCHPIFTDHMTTLVRSLFGHRVRYKFPRLWYTKAQTLREATNGLSDSATLSTTRSCWQSARRVSVSGNRRQCGICAACMLRRMSMYTISCVENRKTYVWENLAAANFEDGAAEKFKNRDPTGAFHEYAIAGTLHLDHLASLSQFKSNQTALDQQCFYLSHSLELPYDEIRTKLEGLLRQHKEEWNSFVESLAPESFVARWIGRK